jgi:D-galactose 1-dehydrogenase
VIAIGVVGMGKIARDQHVPAIAVSPDFELVAIADPAVPEAGLPAYGDCAAMLAAHPKIAAVALCMPPAFRAAAASEALAMRKHVLLEKPPCSSMAEAEALASQAKRTGVSLFTAWHSQKGAAVAAAREWLRGRTVQSVTVTWKEDVRVWHPGQRWLWEEGGFGVFDPGINALSILTTILPGRLRLLDADLSIPANCATPIAARLSIESDHGFAVAAEFDFRQTGPHSWDIDVEAADGFLRLSNGGNRLEIDGYESPVGDEGEYAALYARFAGLIRARRSEVDLAPLRLAEDALHSGRVATVAPFDTSDTDMEELER